MGLLDARTANCTIATIGACAACTACRRLCDACLGQRQTGALSSVHSAPGRICAAQWASRGRLPEPWCGPKARAHVCGRTGAHAPGKHTSHARRLSRAAAESALLSKQVRQRRSRQPRARSHSRCIFIGTLNRSLRWSLAHAAAASAAPLSAWRGRSGRGAISAHKAATMLPQAAGQLVSKQRGHGRPPRRAGRDAAGKKPHDSTPTCVSQPYKRWRGQAGVRRASSVNVRCQAVAAPLSLRPSSLKNFG